jgi:DNA-binding GntR family transcriptional regulator
MSLCLPPSLRTCGGSRRWLPKAAQNLLQALTNRDAAGCSDLIRQHYFGGLAALKAVDQSKSDRTHFA